MLLRPVTRGTSIFVLLFPLPSSGPLKSHLIHNPRMSKLSYLRGSVLSQRLVYTGSPHQVGVCLCASFCVQLFCVVLYAPFFSVFNSSLVAYLTALTVAARRLCHSVLARKVTRISLRCPCTAHRCFEPVAFSPRGETACFLKRCWQGRKCKIFHHHLAHNTQTWHPANPPRTHRSCSTGFLRHTNTPIHTHNRHTTTNTHRLHC